MSSLLPGPSQHTAVCFCFSFYLLTPSFPSSPVSSALPKETSFILARTWSGNFRRDPTLSPGAMLFWWLLEISCLYPYPSISCDLPCLWLPNMVHLGTSALLSCLLSLLFPDNGNILPKLVSLLCCPCIFPPHFMCRSCCLPFTVLSLILFVSDIYCCVTN